MNSPEFHEEHKDSYESLSCLRTPQKPSQSLKSLTRGKVYSHPIPSQDKKPSTPMLGKRAPSTSELDQYSPSSKMRRSEFSESTATPCTPRTTYRMKEPWQIEALERAYNENKLNTHKGKWRLARGTSLKVEQVKKWYHAHNAKQKKKNLAAPEPLLESHGKWKFKQQLESLDGILTRVH